MMTPKQFKALAAAYGSRIERWPPETRADARALARDDEAMRQFLETEAALDRCLDSWPVETPSPELARSIREAARLGARDAGPRTEAARSLTRWLWAEFAGIAAAAVIGFVIGWSGIWSPAPSSADTVDLSGFVFGGGIAIEEDFDNDS
jgi:hypothetical protein